MPNFSGRLNYNPPAPNQTSSVLIENGGFTSLLVRSGLNPAQTANQLFFGLHKGNNAPLVVSGNRSQLPTGENVIIFNSAG